MPYYENLEEKLFNRRLINEGTGCWLWTGGKQSSGHGCVWYPDAGRSVGTHVLAAILWKGYDLWDSMQYHVLHTCENKHCFNPEHLYIGAPQENSNDRKAAGNAYRLEQRKLTNNQVLQIRALHEEGLTRKAIGEAVKVHPATVSKVVRGITYAEVR